VRPSVHAGFGVTAAVTVVTCSAAGVVVVVVVLVVWQPHSTGQKSRPA